jgi:hypothetical protein
MKSLGLLLQAITIVESGGNDWAIGDRHLRQKAYGAYQIRQPVCDDFNDAHGTNYQAEDMLGNWKLSEKICRWYLTTYGSKKSLGHDPTLEDLARIWNGGPKGWKKNSTKGYWRKVAKQLKKRR